jgi:hypothetical protein
LHQDKFVLNTFSKDKPIQNWTTDVFQKWFKTTFPDLPPEKFDGLGCARIANLKMEQLQQAFGVLQGGSVFDAIQELKGSCKHLRNSHY